MKKKDKAQVFTEPNGSELYGYTNPLVYNEVREGTKLDANSEVPPKNSLHSKEALEAAAKSLGDD